MTVTSAHAAQADPPDTELVPQLEVCAQVHASTPQIADLEKVDSKCVDRDKAVEDSGQTGSLRRGIQKVVNAERVVQRGNPPRVVDAGDEGCRPTTASEDGVRRGALIWDETVEMIPRGGVLGSGEHRHSIRHLETVSEPPERGPVRRRVADAAVQRDGAYTQGRAVDFFF